MNFRIEKDALGEILISNDLYYGIYTKRAIENFNISDDINNLRIINALTLVKKACALTNIKLKKLDEKIGRSIVLACDEILSGNYDSQFPINALQGGAGTSTNMNVNEVLANIALEKLNYEKGSYDIIHPINHVNLGQSTNDVYPTAMRIASIYLLRDVANEFALLQETLQVKENEYSHIIKLGRTELMDAVPMMVGQSFSAYAQAIARDRWRLYKVEERLRTINLGGTAIGTSLNTSQKYIFLVTDYIQELTGLGLNRSENLIDATENLDAFVEVSSLLKTAATNLIKIANDFRLLGSGPNGGIGEYIIPPVQVGSSIMPGKVNPVILEMMIQSSYKIISNDLTITNAVSAGNLELNAFGPLIIETLLNSMELLKNSVYKFRRLVLANLKINEEQCLLHLENSFAYATVLVPYLGYDKVSELVYLAKEEHKTLREILIQENVLTIDEINKILNPFNMVKAGGNYHEFK